MQNLHDRVHIFTTPHRFLGGRRVFFDLPKGWVAEDVPVRGKEFPRGWWVGNWDKTAIYWKIIENSGSIKTKNLSFELNILLESHGRNTKTLSGRNFLGENGYREFVDYPAIDDDFINKYYVIFLPKDINSKIDIIVSMRFSKDLKKYVGDIHNIVDNMVRSVSVR